MILALGPQCFSMTTGLCGTAVLGQVCSFLQLLFNYCLLFMVTEGFPWHGPRLLQAAGIGAVTDCHWTAKEWNHRNGELCMGMASSKVRCRAVLWRYQSFWQLRSCICCWTPYPFPVSVPPPHPHIHNCIAISGYVHGAVSMGMWPYIFCKGFFHSKKEAVLNAYFCCARLPFKIALPEPCGNLVGISSTSLAFSHLLYVNQNLRPPQTGGMTGWVAFSLVICVASIKM